MSILSTDELAAWLNPNIRPASELGQRWIVGRKGHKYTICPECDGMGKMGKSKCMGCDGFGVVSTSSRRYWG